MRRFAAYRDLAVALSVREIVIRYKRSALGLVWALAEPVLNVAVYSVVFGRFFGAWGDMPSYTIYVMMGMLPWLFLASTLEQSTSTLIDHSPLIRKIAFPRELLILAVLVSRLTTLVAGLLLALVLAGGKVATGTSFLWERAWLLPIGFIAISALVFGASLVLSALHVILRDVGFLVRFALRLGFFACPIVYVITRVPEEWRALYQLNPLVGVLWCFQAFAAPEADAVSAGVVAYGVGVSLLVAVVGLWAFRRMSSTVADRV